MSTLSSAVEMVAMLLETLSGVDIHDRDFAIQRGLRWLEQNSENTTEVMRVSKLFNDATAIEGLAREREPPATPTVEQNPALLVVPPKTKTLATRALNLGHRLLFQRKRPPEPQSSCVLEESRVDRDAGHRTKNVYIVVTIEEWQCLWEFVDSLKSRAHLAEEENKYWIQVTQD